MQDRSSILFPVLIIFFLTSSPSPPFAVWIEFEIVIDIDTVLIHLHGSEKKELWLKLYRRWEEAYRRNVLHGEMIKPDRIRVREMERFSN